MKLTLKNSIALLFVFKLLSCTGIVNNQSFDIQGHRGARGHYPENTIAGFIKALEMGATTLEMDLVITQTGDILVSHEPWISAEFCLDSLQNPIETTNEKKYNIYQMTYEQIQQFDCGSKVHPRFKDQLKIKETKPLLKDVVEAVENYCKNNHIKKVMYNLEIKSTAQTDRIFHPSPKEFSELVYTFIENNIPKDRVIIQSFDIRVLQYCYEGFKDVRLSFLSENGFSAEENIRGLGFEPAIYSCDYQQLTDEDIKFLHKKHILVIPWTVNEPEMMKQLIERKVDGIITDYPDRLKKIL